MNRRHKEPLWGWLSVALIFVMWVALVSGSAYIAIHFITKFW